MQPDKKVESPPASPPPLTGLSKSQDQDMLEQGEKVLLVIRRSIVGLLGIYTASFVAVGALVTLVIVLSPDTFNTSSSKISGALSAVIVLAAVLLTLILFTATYVYRQSRLLITDRSLVQITQKTLFNRKVSRLSMSNVEDVNEEQRGILGSLFNYGTLNIQTAGAKDNFIFTYCPGPSKLADRVIEARQAYARTYECQE